MLSKLKPLSPVSGEMEEEPTDIPDGLVTLMNREEREVEVLNYLLFSKELIMFQENCSREDDFDCSKFPSQKGEFLIWLYGFNPRTYKGGDATP